MVSAENQPLRPSETRGRVALSGLVAIFVCCSWFCLWLVDFQIQSREPGGFYGHQTEAFLAGQLHLRYAPHPKLAELANPYDGDQNRPYRILDLSYYEGKYYSYFGIGPILCLTLPWRLVTGQYLSEPGATVVLLMATHAVMLLLFWRIRRDFYPKLAPLALWCAYLVASLGNFAAAHLVGGINAGTVAQQGAYLFLILGLCLLIPVVQNRSPLRALAAVALACGLAISCRPSFLPVVGMLVPALLFQHLVWRRPLPGLLLACGLPLAVVAGGLMLYNYARFDSPFQFGNRYQLTDVDYRHIPMLGLGFFLGHWADFLIQPIQFTRYFPFIAHQHDHHPIGLFWGCSITLLSGGLLVGWGREQARPLPLRVLELSLLIAFAGIFVFLAAYRLFLFHYQIDFFVPGVLLGAFGWFAWLDRKSRYRAAHCGVLTVGVLACLATLFTSLGYTLALGHAETRIPSVAKAFNHLVHRWESLRGDRYGSIRLEVKFPQAPPSSREPLIMTGRNARDLCYVVYEPDHRIRFGFFHAGKGGPISEPISLDLATSHTVEVFMGSLLPPPSHPLFAGWEKDAIAQARRLFCLIVDGKEVLRANAEFYPSSPQWLQVGSNNGLSDVSASHFSGDISVVGWSDPTPSGWLAYRAPNTGAATIKFRLPAPPPSAGVDPLLSMGIPGKADLIFIRYLPNSHITLGIDHWGSMQQSSPIRIDPQQTHELTIVANGLGAASQASDRFLLRLNGKTVLQLPLRTHVVEPETVYWGVNGCQSSVSSQMFSGTILEMNPISPDDLGSDPLLFDRAGLVHCTLWLSPESVGRSLPLIASGRPGAADFLYIKVEGPDNVRFGFDHWGVGGALSERIPFDLSSNHELVISFGSVHALESPLKPAAQEYSVLLDGRLVFSGTSPFHPSKASDIHLGLNPFGGSTTEGTLTGQIFDAKIVP